MNKFLTKLAAILLVVSLNLSSHAQPFWGRFQGGLSTDETMAVTGTDEGVTFATGYFSTTAQISTHSLSSNGLSDIFVSRMNSNGNPSWSKSFGGFQNDRGLGIATDQESNVILCGFFTGEMELTAGLSLSANSGSQDAFVLKLNASGEVLWGHAIGGSTSIDRANGVATDGQGNVFVTGSFSGQALFPGAQITSFPGSTDIFIAKYSAGGDFLWVRTGTGLGQNRGLAIAVDQAGDAYVTGQFGEDITFGQTYPCDIMNALYIVKFNGNGDEEWFRFAGGSSQSIGYGITAVDDKVYITGDCGSNLTFFNGTTFPSITSDYDNAVFLTSYNTDGQYQWGTSLGSHSPLSSRAVSARNGEIGITGFFECRLDELSEVYGEGIFNNIGYRDIFVTRYTDAGEFLWANHMGGRENDAAYGIYIHADNIESIGGSYYTTIYAPRKANVNPSNMTEELWNTTPGFCGDAGYGHIASMTSNIQTLNLDGFVMRILSAEREPLDIYRRSMFDTCDRSIPKWG